MSFANHHKNLLLLFFSARCLILRQRLQARDGGAQGVKESSLPKFNNIQYAFKFANNCDANHKDSAIILGDRFL
ncbi:hypothetical protein BS640_16065 [Rouxiella badensis]|jgi:hypothetical protein|uniref:Uncharacterized protein n=1 Tax=Rouxiella badensis TaxID=1646377 RepID=A0A1X0WCJ5_9GAMM|nr:hypothetical protein BS640_16065 [Rouxiella badensis]